MGVHETMTAKGDVRDVSIRRTEYSCLLKQLYMSINKFKELETSLNMGMPSQAAAASSPNLDVSIARTKGRPGPQSADTKGLNEKAVILCPSRVNGLSQTCCGLSLKNVLSIFVFAWLFRSACGTPLINFSKNMYFETKGKPAIFVWNGTWDHIFYTNGIPTGHCNGGSYCPLYDKTNKNGLELNKLEDGSTELKIPQVDCCTRWISVEPTGGPEHCRTARVHVCGCEAFDMRTCPFEKEMLKSGCAEEIISLQRSDCGGIVTKAGGIIFNSGVNQTMECTWVIQVPADNSTNLNIIKAQLSMTGNADSDDNTLVVKDGNSACAPEYVPRLNRTITSRTNFLWINYYFKTRNNSRPINFTLDYSTALCGQMCNNSICMHSDWRCNGENDCGDWSDELNCCPPHVDTQNSIAGWIILSILVGVVIGTVIGILIGWNKPCCIRYIAVQN